MAAAAGRLSSIRSTSATTTPTPAAQLDLNDNDLILTNGGDTNSIRNLLIAGYNAGAWNGNGLASTAAAATHPGPPRLGYGLAGDLGITSLDGNPINDPNTVIVKYTYYGDSSLDGKVDLGNDFNLFVQGYLGAGTGWEFGDYNYDGSTNSADFGLLIDGFKQQGGSPWAQLDSVIESSRITQCGRRKSELLSVRAGADEVWVCCLLVRWRACDSRRR